MVVNIKYLKELTPGSGIFVVEGDHKNYFSADGRTNIWPTEYAWLNENKITKVCRKCHQKVIQDGKSSDDYTYIVVHETMEAEVACELLQKISKGPRV